MSIVTAKEILEMKPYDYRYAGRELLIHEKWEIRFEDRVVRTLTGVNEDFMKHMIFLLNTAFHMGYMQGHTAGQFDPIGK